MPIFEYLCPSCNRVFSFLSKTLVPTKQPACPKCKSKNLKKMVSRFALVGAASKSRDADKAPAADREAGPDRDGPGGGGPDQGGGADDALDPRVEREMEHLMQDAEGIDENDPRQLGALMRRMTQISGEKLDPEMEEAVRRLESGEDPEKVEEAMGDALGDDKGGPGGGPPSYDGGLYDM